MSNVTLAVRPHGKFKGSCLMFNGTELQLYFQQEVELDEIQDERLRKFRAIGLGNYIGAPLCISATLTFNILTPQGQKALVEKANKLFNKAYKGYEAALKALVDAEKEGKLTEMQIDEKFKIYTFADIIPFPDASEPMRLDDGTLLFINKQGQVKPRAKHAIGDDILPVYMTRQLVDTTEAGDLKPREYGSTFLEWKDGSYVPKQQEACNNSIDALLGRVVTPVGLE